MSRRALSEQSISVRVQPAGAASRCQSCSSELRPCRRLHSCSSGETRGSRARSHAVRLVSAGTTTPSRSTPTRACATRITSPTSSSLGAWREWRCSMENCWTVSRRTPRPIRLSRGFSGVFRVLRHSRTQRRCSAGFFIRPFYKMMLGKQISLKDMESVVRFQGDSSIIVLLQKTAAMQGLRIFPSCTRRFNLSCVACRPCRTVNTTTLLNGSWRMTPPSWT